MKTILAMFGGAVVLFITYQAGSMKYDCVSPAVQPMADGSGRWFYMCTGPEPRPSERVSFTELRQRFAMMPPATEPAARVSPPRPIQP